MTHVVIVGGGVAGMTAAQELIDRKLRVTVLERDPRPGGKARSYDAPSPISTGKLHLPGEHGFRFFPHFYQNIRKTMGRIPLQTGKKVSDNLVPASEAMLARAGQSPIVFHSSTPGGIEDMVVLLERILAGHNTGLTPSDLFYFSTKVFQIMTCCPERALVELERTTWWNFLRADKQSKAFKTYLVEGLTRCLVAARARDANVRAGGVVLTQLFYGLLTGQTIDWVLNGPTDDAWLRPWHEYLLAQGVEFRLNTEVTAFAISGNAISGVEVKEKGTTKTVSGDYYIAALPVEAIQALWSQDMERLDTRFARNLASLAGDVDWMTGLQFFLDKDETVTHGHITFIDSPWALTAISQPQFWPSVDLTRYGDGAHLGILSVDISEWEVPGIVHRKPAKQCTESEIAEDVWKQMVDRLNADGVTRISPIVPTYRFLDPNIICNPYPVENRAKLFINKIGSWERRPENRTPLTNLYLASDYVRTDTNLATMEAANESARRAVDALFRDHGVGSACAWDSLPDPFVDELGPLRELDCVMFRAGRPWSQPAMFHSI